ncbi:MAG: hypothetical protein NWR42_11180 [Desulfobacterales bacterium]|nr:hypothetical protein [Desulfobacterales bacterium]
MKRHPPDQNDPSVSSIADPTAPGGVYLCQVNRQVSCAACCGLYNVADAAYGPLVSMLSERTKEFAGVPRQADAIAAFGQRAQTRCGTGPINDFHHCPFVGLIGEEHLRVGCLLHPHAAGNRGVDYRGLSYYGGMACRLYFCPAHSKLSAVVKTVVRESAVSWYEYGLIVSETRLLSQFFKALEERLGSPLTVADILSREDCRQIVGRVLRLKIDWPFRRRPDPGPCNYVFDDRLYPKPAVGYPPQTTLLSPYDILLEELLSVFNTPAELELAERMLADLIESLARGILAGRRAQTLLRG